jgi:hypothetical protein
MSSSKSSKLTKLVRKNKTKQEQSSSSKALTVFKQAPATSRVMSSAIPANIGVSMPRSSFGMAGRAQVVADYDPDCSLRVKGRDLFYAPIQAGSSDAKAGFGGTATYYVAVTPKEIAARLANIQAIFQWYAIRGLRVFYAPATGSTSTVQIALGYMSNFDIASDITTPTQTQVLEMQPAALFPAWQPAVIDIIHRGTKLFSCDAKNVTDANYRDFYQGVLASTLMNGVATTTYGQLWVEYVVDFYQPCPIQTTLSRHVQFLGPSRFALGLIGDPDAAPPVRCGRVYKHASAEEGKLRISSDDDSDFNVAPPAFAGAPSDTPCGIRTLKISSSPPISTAVAALAPAAPKGYFR